MTPLRDNSFSDHAAKSCLSRRVAGVKPGGMSISRQDLYHIHGPLGALCFRRGLTAERGMEALGLGIVNANSLADDPFGFNAIGQFM